MRLESSAPTPRLTRESEKDEGPSLSESLQTSSARTVDQRFWPSRAATSRGLQSVRGCGPRCRPLKAPQGRIKLPRQDAKSDSNIPRQEPALGPISDI